MESKWLKIIAIDLIVITVLLFLFIGTKICYKMKKCSMIKASACSLKTKCSKKNINTPSHFEFLANDVLKAEKFYSDVFGWKFQKDRKLDYTIIQFGKGHPVSGGLMKKPENFPTSTATLYFTVSNLKEIMAKVEQAGGKILMPKTKVDGEGWFAICTDAEGVHFGLWEINHQSKKCCTKKK
ncbi:MAG: VOC family protein [bacterium]|nr:VOC family protein [bacterium]